MNKFKSKTPSVSKPDLITALATVVGTAALLYPPFDTNNGEKRYIKTVILIRLIRHHQPIQVLRFRFLKHSQQKPQLENSDF